MLHMIVGVSGKHPLLGIKKLLIDAYQSNTCSKKKYIIVTSKLCNMKFSKDFGVHKSSYAQHIPSSPSVKVYTSKT